MRYCDHLHFCNGADIWTTVGGMLFGAGPGVWSGEPRAEVDSGLRSRRAAIFGCSPQGVRLRSFRSPDSHNTSHIAQGVAIAEGEQKSSRRATDSLLWLSLAMADSTKPPAQAAAASPRRPPLIPLDYIDAPTQRLWAVSLAAATQSYKLYTFLTPSASLSLALLLDLALVLCLARLCIPRLDFTDAVWVGIACALGFLDWILLGGWDTLLPLLGLGGITGWLSSVWEDVFSRPMGLSEHRVRVHDLVRPGSHLLGQHTIHILPYSTATFSPSIDSCHCIGGTGKAEITIPVLFNNTEPHALQYSVTPFGNNQTPRLYNVTIPRTKLVTLEAASEGFFDAVDYGEWDEVEAEVVGSGALVRRQGHHGSHSAGQVTRGQGGRLKLSRSQSAGQQKAFDLVVRETGRLRLERVLDRSGMDARIAGGQLMIVGCPQLTFTSTPLFEASQSRQHDATKSLDQHMCPGNQGQMDVQVHGTAPMEVTYRKTWTPSSSTRAKSQPQEESLQISQIADPNIVSPLVGTDTASAERILSVLLARHRASKPDGTFSSFDWAVPQTQTASLSFSADKVGSHTYDLESIRDACGNVVSAEALHTARQSQSSSNGRIAGPDAEALALISSARFHVHSRAHAKIAGCSAEKPLQLLRGGPPKDVVFQAVATEPGLTWSASVRFEPESPEESDAANQPWTKNVTFGRDGIARVQAERPGNFFLDNVDGPYCSGEVGSPWVCPVVQLPVPTADITFSAIEDVCAGSVGVNALAVLSGQPPFRLQYEIRKSGKPVVRQERVIERTREEFEFRPSTEGAVEYRFVALSDSNYRHLALDGPTFEQVVHPLASAAFVQEAAHNHQRKGDQSMIMRSCEGNRAQAQIKLEGKGPFDLTYAVRAISQSGERADRPATKVEHKTVHGISGPLHELAFDLPPQINAHGGFITVSLVSIRDAKNCERALTTSDLSIEIRRARPTAEFILPSTHHQRNATSNGESEVLEGQEARLPVRLQGEGPWKVEYIRHGDAIPVTATLRSAEADIVVDRPGMYELVSVQDAYCKGDVLSAVSQWHVWVRQRPSAQFTGDAGSRSPNNGSLLRRAVCKGRPDSAGIVASGQYPISITYEHLAPSWAQTTDDNRPQQQQQQIKLLTAEGIESSAGRRKRRTFATAQNLTALHLVTDTPGWHRYQLVEVGDAVYSLSSLSAAATKHSGPRKAAAEPLSLEQYVHALPTATFIESDSSRGHRSGAKKESFCLGDSLTSSSDRRGPRSPTVRLSGTPPFRLEFELASTSNTQSARRFVRSDIREHTFSLDLTESDIANDQGQPFKFDSTGKWTYRILSLVDGNGCESVNAPGGKGGDVNPSLGGSGGTSAYIEVAETASIAPVGTREHYCVGDTVEYVLQGTPPWTVTYAFNGKESAASNMRAALFSRVAEREGVLEIRSVAHQTNTCRRVVDAEKEAGMRRVVHPLPRAKIMEGGKTVQDLREGASATITFHLEGTPPFSLTYQHLEPEDYYTQPKVLSEATVAGIMEHEYSVSTHEEGTWRIVWLQDRYCQSAAPARVVAGV
ncbi:unnamed protein product [Parajaminaea phylloscopi]